MSPLNLVLFHRDRDHSRSVEGAVGGSVITEDNESHHHRNQGCGDRYPNLQTPGEA